MRKVVAVITACMMLPAIADVSPDPSIPVVPAGQALENLPPPPDSHRLARDPQTSDSAGQTATETGTVGFNLYGVTSDGGVVKLTERITLLNVAITSCWKSCGDTDRGKYRLRLGHLKRSL